MEPLCRWVIRNRDISIIGFQSFLMALLTFGLVEAKVYSNFSEDLPDRITKPRQGWVVYYI